jgi:sec-independent protein translocase protein TatA
MNLGPTELIIILVIVLILFGGARLPKLARSLGQASKEFKDGVGEGHGEGHKDAPAPTEPQVTAEAPKETPSSS